MSSDINISFFLNVKDIYKANMAIISSNKAVFYTLWGIVFIIVGSAGFVLTMGALGYPSHLSPRSLWIAMFLPSFLIWRCYASPYFAAKSLHRDSINIQNAIRYTISDALITQEMSTGRAELEWTTFTKVRETRDLFLLYVQKNLAHPIPKRAFANEGEIERFRELVRPHIKDASLYDR